MVDETSAEGAKKSRPRNLYGYVREAWKVPSASWLKDVRRDRLLTWRKGESFVRLERPTRVDRARGPGDRAKPGVVLVGPGGRAPSEAPRDVEDHDGEIDSADCGGAVGKTVSEPPGVGVVLGWGGWDA